MSREDLLTPVYYMPVVNRGFTGAASTGVVASVEALAKDPGVFAGASEIVQLRHDMAAASIAAAQVASWRDNGVLPGLGLALNAEPGYLKWVGYASVMVERVRAAKLKPSDLTLEIVERAPLDLADENVRDNLRLFTKEGVKLAIDDFGSGHHTLKGIRPYLDLPGAPFSSLKVDHLVTVALLAGPECSGYPEAVKAFTGAVHIARDHNLELVVEGIERADAAEFVCKLVRELRGGVPLLQGNGILSKSSPERIALYAAGLVVAA